jgi:hypothetical protein
MKKILTTQEFWSWAKETKIVKNDILDLLEAAFYFSEDEENSRPLQHIFVGIFFKRHENMPVLWSVDALYQLFQAESLHDRVLLENSLVDGFRDVDEILDISQESDIDSLIRSSDANMRKENLYAMLHTEIIDMPEIISLYRYMRLLSAVRLSEDEYNWFVDNDIYNNFKNTIPFVLQNPVFKKTIMRGCLQLYRDSGCLIEEKLFHDEVQLHITRRE